MRVFFLAVCLTSWALGPRPVVAGEQAESSSKTPTIDQSLEAFSVSSPKISPDGKRVVYEQSHTNWDSNAFDTELWIADVATGSRHLLSMRGSSSSDAEWSPDGRWIAFL